MFASLKASSSNCVRIDRLGSRSICCDQYPQYFVDYSDQDSLVRILTGIDIVYHLAGRAHKSVSSSCDADLFWQANVDTLISVVKASELARVKRIVFVSSIGVLGSYTEGLPFDDYSIPAPSAHYSRTKLEAEMFLKTYLKPGSSALEWVILRPPLIYGPRCPGNMNKLINAVKFLPFIPFGSCFARKSFISIDNFVDVLKVSAISSAAVGQTFVVSDVDDFTVREMFRLILLGLGRHPWRLFSVYPPFLSFISSLFGVSGLWHQLTGELRVDSSRFCNLTGWKPIVPSRDSLSIAAGSFRK